MITSEQQSLIRASFEKVRPHQERAGALFYESLFFLAPGIAPLFQNTKMDVQASKLIQIIAYVVDHLNEWPGLAITVRQLGARHVRYGVQPDHYAFVGAALITTLSDTLGPDFSEDTEEAWTELYTHLSLLMEQGQAGN